MAAVRSWWCDCGMGITRFRFLWRVLLPTVPILACLPMIASNAFAEPSVEPNPASPDTMSEMERLIDVLEGRWTTQASYEPDPRTPYGTSAVGWEECRVGPGRASVLIEGESYGVRGTFEGAGFITWNAGSRTYNLHWLSTSSPEPGVFTGQWSGDDVVFDGYEYVAKERFASRHSITDIRADGFVYTIDMGPAPDHLRRKATIDYTRD
jgi:hypothetical protein